MNKEKIQIKLEVNGTLYEKEVTLKTTLLDLLRDELDLKGTKKGCDSGHCGACTVILNGKAVNSCQILALQADEGKVTTIEGISSGKKLHPLQKSFIDEGAVQCGFCTPGMIMSAKALLDENSKPNEKEIKEALSGNLCRCTGYEKIISAVKKAAENY